MVLEQVDSPSYLLDGLLDVGVLLEELLVER